MSDSAFPSTLAAEVERGRGNLRLDNYDVSQLDRYDSEKHREDLAGPRGSASPSQIAERLARFSEVSFLYDRLADQESRELLIKLFAYRTLGFRHVKLPRNTPDYWNDIQSQGRAETDTPPLPIAFMNARLPFYDLRSFGYDVRAYASSPGLACAYVQKQYEYRRAGVVCKAQPGDIAIDAGACWGETTVYFAHEVGAHGRVLAFEFIPSNLAVLRRNLKANLALAARIEMVENPLWSTSGRVRHHVDWGPGSRVSADPARYPGANQCTTVSIDDGASARQLARVDFIKMDIEGAELEALKGAERSLRAHRPRLAISLYQSAQRLHHHPRYLESLGLGYRYYLDHHTIYLNETVMFALPA